MNSVITHAVYNRLLFSELKLIIITYFTDLTFNQFRLKFYRLFNVITLRSLPFFIFMPFPSERSRPWHSLSSFISISVNCYNFLEKIVEWILVAFSTLLNVKFFISSTDFHWRQENQSLLAILSIIIREGRNRFMRFQKELV